MVDISELVNLISLGAGVQSSTMALMAAAGEITPMPKAAIFADTQDEPAGVYRWLDWLESQLPFPIYRVTRGKLSDRELTSVRSKRSGRVYRKSSIPVFMLGDDKEKGMLSRKCTRDFKLDPIFRKARELAGIKRGQKSPGVVQWIGISLDEIQRMKPSRFPWSVSRHPLIEIRMTRQGCLDCMESRGYPQPPRSACVFCPFHSDREWRRLQLEEPDEFARAVVFERNLQAASLADDVTNAVPYLHAKRVPLDTIDFRSDVEHGQMTMWDDECEGMCGV